MEFITKIFKRSHIKLMFLVFSFRTIPHYFINLTQKRYLNLKLYRRLSGIFKFQHDDSRVNKLGKINIFNG